MKRFQIFNPSDEYGNLDVTDFEDSIKQANAVNGIIVNTDESQGKTEVVSSVGADKYPLGMDPNKPVSITDIPSLITSVFDSNPTTGEEIITETVVPAVKDVYNTGKGLLDGIEFGAIGIGLLLAWGVAKSFSQSSVDNVGRGVSRVIKSAK